MKDFYFQKCQLQDLLALQAISIQTFSSTYQHLNTPENFNQHINYAFNKKQLTIELQNPNMDFYFLIKKAAEGETATKVIGYLKLNEKDAQTEKMPIYCYEIERIYLLKEFQGQGFGKILIDKSIELALSKNKKEVWLGVWKKNPNAIGFYKKMGFEIFGEHVFKVGDEEQIDYVMKMELGIGNI